MTDPLPPAAPACERCGYSLAGISVQDGTGICPECGVKFDAWRPWHHLSWPRLRGLLWRLCGPASMAASALVAIGTVRELRNWLVWPLWSVWIGLMFTLGVVWPFAEIGRLAKDREPELTRAARRRRLLTVAILINALITLSGIVGFLAVTRWR